MCLNLCQLFLIYRGIFYTKPIIIVVGNSHHKAVPLQVNANKQKHSETIGGSAFSAICSFLQQV